MDTLAGLVTQAEGLLGQVAVARDNLEQLQSRLDACREELADQLAGLRGGTPAEEKVVRAEPVRSSPNAQAKPPKGRERRALPRRRGNPVAVRVSNPRFEGWVLDRSPDGLSLLSDAEVAVGTHLSVCPSEPGSSHWYLVEVRSCRPRGKNWVLGCRFLEKLSWQDLRQFG